MAPFNLSPEREALSPLSGSDLYDADLQELAAYAAQVVGAPVALVTELGESHQTFLARVGTDRTWTPLEESFCIQTVLQTGVLEVADTTQDSRFRDNPLVTGEPNIRFYAGVPIQTGGKTPTNALCVLDLQPRELTEFQRTTLRFLARQVESRLAIRHRERAMREERAWLDRTLETTGVASLDVDVARNRIAGNAVLEALFGVARSSEGEPVEKYLRAIHPDDMDAVRAAFARTMATGEPLEVPFRVRTPEGRERNVLGRGEVSFGPQGQPVRISGIVVDLSARAESDRTLAFLRRFADAVIDQRDADATVALAQRMLGEHLGVQRVVYGEISADGLSAHVRRDWTDGLPSVVGQHRLADFATSLIENLQSGRPHVSRDSERDYAPGDGLEAVRAIGSRASLTSPIMRDGRLHSFLVVHSILPRDWTEAEIGLVRQVADRLTAAVERSGAETALRNANEVLEARVEARTADLKTAAESLARAVSEAEGFNYAISHDLRTPLRAISMTASILLEEASSGMTDEHRDLLDRQNRAAARLAQLIDGLLKLSRLSRVELNRRPLDMTREARSVAREDTECVLEVQEGMTAHGDPGLIHSVWQNLIGNACKFSPNGASVEVGQEGGAFFVRDRGVGFDMQYADKIFLPFERLVSDAEFPGTGIGLANVKRIVERHGGRIWCESATGEGATFWFTLG